MDYKFTILNARIKVTEFFSKATNKDYFNLFQPVIPKIDLTGKIAQTISAATEAVTVWLICQSELSEVNKYAAFFISLIAVVLVVAAIEIGGRKGLQVLSRAVVWKKLKNAWYWILFIFVAAITGFLFYQSYGLSTKGVNQSFKQSVAAATIFDDSQLNTRHLANIDRINIKYDQQIKSTTAAFNLEYSAKENEFDAKIKAVEVLIIEHSDNKKKGVKWAGGHLKKQTKIKSKIESDKSAALAALTTNHTSNIKAVEATRLTELNKEDVRHTKAIDKGETAENENHNSNRAVAQFWGDLFSGLVGGCIIIAFVCIVVVEIFRKGSGIEIDYQEVELPPTLLNIAIEGINNRLFNVSYKAVGKLYVEKKTFDFFKTVDASAAAPVAEIVTEEYNEFEENNEWNSFLSDELREENKGFENGFSLNHYNKNFSPLRQPNLYEKDIPIVHLNGKEKGTSKRVEVKGFLQSKSKTNEGENNLTDDGKKLHRLPVLPIYDINKLNKRDKEKFKKKQKTRIEKFYKKYHLKHGKKPSYSVISDALGMTEKTVGNYVRLLKKEEKL